MIAYIICEGDDDTQLLKTILPAQLLNEVYIAPAGRLSSVKTLASSIVVRRQKPVAIVVDADSTVPEFVQERIQDIREIVESVSINTPIQVTLFIPEMEAIFFQDPDLLSRLLGYSPSQNDLSLAVSQPKKVLNDLLAKSNQVHNIKEMIEQLAHENLDTLQHTPVIQDLIHFLESVHEPVLT